MRPRSAAVRARASGLRHCGGARSHACAPGPRAPPPLRTCVSQRRVSARATSEIGRARLGPCAARGHAFGLRASLGRLEGARRATVRGARAPRVQRAGVLARFGVRVCTRGRSQASF